MSRTSIRLAPMLLVVVACGPTAVDDAQDIGGTDAADERDAAIHPDAAASASCDKMDILFVIDDSGSMDKEQANLAASFPGFISVLDAFTTSAGDSVDYRVGVTTTGVTKNFELLVPGIPPVPTMQSGDDGRLRSADCGMTGSWLERGDPNVSDTFSCVAQVGIDGPTDEMPLEAARLAVGPRIDDGSNADFLRDDALLAVVILTDEDDCSRTDDGFTVDLTETLCSSSEPVETYLSAFDEVKEERGRWAVAIIAGTGPGRCSSTLGDADEATRLLDFAEQVGDNAVTSSICEGDLSQGLADALATFEAACDSFPGID